MSRSSTQLMGASSILLHACRLLIGLVFIFSGFVKAVDPLGTIYKIQDYLFAFGGFFSELIFLAYPVAFLLILVELVIGLNLFFQVRFKMTAWIAFVFMLVMTPLTLYIALYNPVSDCGCFGDALKISNWQTFYKNVFFFLFALTLLVFNKQFRDVYLPSIERIMIGFFVVCSIGFMVYNLNYLPLLDFRPYKVGVNIPEAMQVPADAPVDEYSYNFTYEKAGIKKSFALDQLPDSTWTFVSQETKLIKEGYRPPIHDFSILTADFDDITDKILDYPGKTYLLVMYDLNKTSNKGVEKANELFLSLNNPNVKFYGLTSSSTQEIQEFKANHQLTFPFYKMDPITLKTMIRANPGLILIKKGTIKGKWNWRSINEIK